MVFVKGIFLIIFISFSSQQEIIDVVFSQLNTECSRDDGTKGVYKLLGKCENSNVIVGEISLLNRFVVCCRVANVGEKSKDYCEKYGKELAEPESHVWHINQGENSKVGEFPHMAALGYKSSEPGKYDFLCGGSLISEKFVITAAHCLKRREKKAEIVRIGRVSKFNVNKILLTLLSLYSDFFRFNRHP